MRLLVPILLGAFLADMAEAAPRSSSAGEAVEAKPNWVFEVLPRSMQSRPRVDFWIVTEHTRRGLELGLPAVERPLYFVSESGGFHSAGEPVRERPPSAGAIERVLRSVLQAQGLQPAGTGHPAQVLLVYSWGSHHREMIPGEMTRSRPAQRWDNYDRNPRTVEHAYDPLLGYSDHAARAQIGWPPLEYRPDPMPAMDDVSWAPDRPAPMRKADLIERAALLVGDSFARRLRGELTYTFEDRYAGGPAMSAVLAAAQAHPRGRFLIQTINQSLFFVAVTAYDVAGVARGRRDVLWRTKIAVTADGVSLVETMPAMLIAAAPHLGRPMVDAVLEQRRLDRRGRVVIGEAEMIGWEAGRGPAPVKRAEAQP